MFKFIDIFFLTTKRLAYILLFLLFSVLFGIKNPCFFNASQTNDYFIFSYVLIVLSVLLSVVKIRQDFWKGNWHIVDILITILLFYVISYRYFLQEYSPLSINYYEMIGLYVLYLVLRLCLVDATAFLLLAVAIGGVFQLLLGELQLLNVVSSNHSHFPLTGSFFNPGPYAGYIAASFPIVLGFCIYSGKKSIFSFLSVTGFSMKSVKKYANIGMVLFVIVLLSTESRASWIAVLTSSTYIFFFKNNKPTSGFIKLISNRRAIICLVIISIVTRSFFYSYKKKSVEGRMLIWKIASEMIVDNPLTGIGFDNFSSSFINYQATFFNKAGNEKFASIAAEPRYCFNDYLQFIVENGLPAGGLLFLIAFCIFKVVRSRQNSCTSVAMGGLLSSIVFSLFSYPSHILPIKVVTVLYLAVIINSAKNRRSFVFPIKGRWFIIIKAMLLLVVFFVSADLNSFLSRQFNAFEDWGVGNNLFQNCHYNDALRYYQRAYSELHNEGDFLTQYGKALSVSGENLQGVKVLKLAEKYTNSAALQTTLGNCLQELGNYQMAEEAYNKASKINPKLFYPHYLLAKLYFLQGKTVETKSVIKKLFKKDVKINSLAITEMKTELENILLKLEERSK